MNKKEEQMEYFYNPSNKKEEYGENFQEHLLEQYKTYSMLADSISDRRHKTNIFYSSLFSVAIPVIMLIVTEKIISNFIMFIISILGMVLCVGWFINIHSYKQLNSGKYKVIIEMENLLPFPCYDMEWKHLDKGNNSKKYFKLTRVEKCVPIVFLTPFFVLFVYSLFVFFK